MAAPERQRRTGEYAILTEDFDRVVPKLQTGLAVYKFLRLHPGAPPQQWPGELSWAAITGYFFDSEQKTAQQSVILAHMPHAEVRRDAELYARLDLLNQQFQELAEARAAATTIAIQQPNPAMLTSAQIDHQIDLTAAILRRRANIASWMRVLNLRYPDFQPAPSQQAIQGILHNQSDATVQAAATALFEKIYQFELEQRREAGESSSTNDAAEPAR